MTGLTMSQEAADAMFASFSEETRSRFSNRNLDNAVECCVWHYENLKIDAPERLLFMNDEAIRSICEQEGGEFDELAYNEIVVYRRKYRPTYMGDGPMHFADIDRDDFISISLELDDEMRVPGSSGSPGFVTGRHPEFGRVVMSPGAKPRFQLLSERPFVRFVQDGGATA